MNAMALGSFLNGMTPTDTSSHDRCEISPSPPGRRLAHNSFQSSTVNVSSDG
jgi:hypothetical protein